MPKIDISGLPKAKVIAALIENVFGRWYEQPITCEEISCEDLDPFREVFKDSPRDIKDYNKPPNESEIARYMANKQIKMMGWKSSNPK